MWAFSFSVADAANVWRQNGIPDILADGSFVGWRAKRPTSLIVNFLATSTVGSRIEAAKWNRRIESVDIAEFNAGQLTGFTDLDYGQGQHLRLATLPLQRAPLVAIPETWTWYGDALYGFSDPLAGYEWEGPEGPTFQGMARPAQHLDGPFVSSQIETGDAAPVIFADYEDHEHADPALALDCLAYAPGASLQAYARFASAPRSSHEGQMFTASSVTVRDLEEWVFWLDHRYSYDAVLDDYVENPQPETHTVTHAASGPGSDGVLGIAAAHRWLPAPFSDVDGHALSLDRWNTAAPASGALIVAIPWWATTGTGEPTHALRWRAAGIEIQDLPGPTSPELRMGLGFDGSGDTAGQTTPWLNRVDFLPDPPYFWRYYQSDSSGNPWRVVSRMFRWGHGEVSCVAVRPGNPDDFADDPGLAPPTLGVYRVELRRDISYPVLVRYRDNEFDVWLHVAPPSEEEEPEWTEFSRQNVDAYCLVEHLGNITIGDGAYDAELTNWVYHPTWPADIEPGTLVAVVALGDYERDLEPPGDELQQVAYTMSLRFGQASPPPWPWPIAATPEMPGGGCCWPAP